MNEQELIEAIGRIAGLQKIADAAGYVQNQQMLRRQYAKLVGKLGYDPRDRT